MESLFCLKNSLTSRPESGNTYRDRKKSSHEPSYSSNTIIHFTSQYSPSPFSPSPSPSPKNPRTANANTYSINKTTYHTKNPTHEYDFARIPTRITYKSSPPHTCGVNLLISIPHQQANANADADAKRQTPAQAQIKRLTCMSIQQQITSVPIYLYLVSK